MSTNSLRLSMLMQDAHSNDSLADARAAYRLWQSCHCYHPFRVRTYDAHSGTYRFKDLPCGKCYHCRESHINEWVTRMYAHCEDFKNVYFITLTYRSFSNPDLRDFEKLMMNKLAQACWHKDAYNDTHRFAWSPCLLSKSHYQNFLKRLRKYSGLNDITYAISGEMGKKWGRPHFHLILFTNGVLDPNVVKRAWSVALFKHNRLGWQYKTNQSSKNGVAYYFPIGRVDFHDLVRNGTMNTAAKVKVDGTYMNAANCFSYVCKYVCKQDNYNKRRVQLAYNSMYEKKSFVRLYENEIPAYLAKNWLQDHGIYVTKTNYHNFIKHAYEKVIRKEVSPYFYTSNLQTEKVYNFYGAEVVEQLFPSDYLEFTESFTPFVEFSRGTPIGSLYAKTHIQEFAQGVFNKPILQDKSYALPRYFFTKAQEFLYGLRRVRQTGKSISYNLSNMPNLRGLLSSMRETVPIDYLVEFDCSLAKDISSLVKSDLAFFDKSTGEHIVFPNYNGLIRVECYKYDRHSRSYYLSRSIPLDDFLHYWLDRLDGEQVRYRSRFVQEKENVRLLDRAFLLAIDLGFDYVTSRDRFISEQDVYLHQKQLLYDDVHIGVD